MNPNLQPYYEKMNKSIDALSREFSTIRAGRANPGVLEKIIVSYYGVPTPINQMAAVTVPEARTLQIAPWDRTTLSMIEKAILTSDLGVNPNNDGETIKINFPALTAERRKELTKGIAKQGEECKVAVRSIRRDANDKFKAMKKGSEMSEDELKSIEKETQEITDKCCKQIDMISEAKEKEIMEI